MTRIVRYNLLELISPCQSLVFVPESSDKVQESSLAIRVIALPLGTIGIKIVRCVARNFVMQYVNIKIAGQSVHPIILIRLFIVPYVESIINVIFPDSIY